MSFLQVVLKNLTKEKEFVFELNGEVLRNEKLAGWKEIPLTPQTEEEEETEDDKKGKKDKKDKDKKKEKEKKSTDETEEAKPLPGKVMWRVKLYFYIGCQSGEV